MSGNTTANAVVLTGKNYKTGTVTNIKRLDINILKVDSSDNTKKLDGATFTLRKLTKDSTAAGTDTSFEQQPGTTAGGGKVKFIGLVAIMKSTKQVHRRPRHNPLHHPR